ncbi:MAG: sulfotransferase family 2 domain-containing protein [Oscillatoria sp. PMC 1051.18]|nr:sulfotransferase family 2 domain-containing protein [Oscillatoria sp. PMC 1050.18]MEC5032994.1 sulfotransferase family 2 domain-containing protein [Oscillatoria sp. PMC 1051.18]
MNNHEKPKSLIFLHIPKSAGTTLNKIIENNYDKDTIFTIGIDTQGSINKFKNIPELERKKIKVLKGHMPFGLHELMPQPCTYITLLRHPVERIISSYHYILRSPVHYLHNYVTTKQISLENFVSTGMSTDTDNGQTRRLAGVSAGKLSGERIVDFGECYPELLTQAKENLINHFSVVGVVDKFDESLLLMKKELAWNNCYYISRNITKHKPNERQIKKETIEIIKENNQLDLQLYTFAQELLSQKIDKQGNSFAQELKNFQAKNNFYARLNRLKYWSRLEASRLKKLVMGAKYS